MHQRQRKKKMGKVKVLLKQHAPATDSSITLAPPPKNPPNHPLSSFPSHLQGSSSTSATHRSRRQQLLLQENSGLILRGAAGGVADCTAREYAHASLSPSDKQPTAVSHLPCMCTV